MIKLKTHRFSSAKCVECGYEIDAASSLHTKKRPRPGDIMICAQCSCLMIFSPDGVRTPTGDEMIEIAGDPGMLLTIHALDLARKRKARQP